MKRLTALLLLLLACVLVVQAQSLAVQSFRQDETDLTANTTGTIVIDQNGQKCALIKVETTQQGFSFDAGSLGVVKTEQKVGEIWVYMPKGVKRLTISHQQLGMLRDYDLGQTLKRAKTYILKLTSGEVQTVVKQARTSQYVVFQVQPRNAVVMLNGEMLQTADGVGTKMMRFGTYDVNRNTGYMTFGGSHDTAEFACDCLVEQWEKHLRHVYPSAKCICILCDGGGSNNARSWQFKWCLMETAKRLGIDIRIAHYPPYCSKWNPIEHMLFSQISRVWSGAVFNTVEEASEMAAKTTTKTGLAVFTTINRNIYETKKERNPLFESECERYIVKDEFLPKWNYLVKCN